MKKENRLLSEKSKYKLVFKEQFKIQLENFIERYYMETGKRIKISDVKKKLAEYVDVDEKTVSKWNTGTVFPEIENIIKIAEFFNCSIDELLTNKNPYDEITKQWEEKKLSTEAIKKSELLLREPLKIKPLFGDEDIPQPKWKTIDFLNDLLGHQDIDKIINCYLGISKEFFYLTAADIKKVNASIEKEKHTIENSNALLNTLWANLPDKANNKLKEYRQQIENFATLYTADYILNIYYKETQNKDNSK